MHLNLDKAKVGGAVYICNYAKTKYCILSPFTLFKQPANDIVTYQNNNHKAHAYDVEINPEDTAIWVHFKGELLGPNGTPSYQTANTQASVEYKWTTGNRNDLLVDNVRD